MRDFTPILLAHLAERGARHAQVLIWIEAKDRATGAPATIGLWSGADHETFSINGQARDYYGAGTILKVPPIITERGMSVRTTRMEFSAVAPEVQEATRGYETRNAPFQMHIANFDPQTEQLIAEPHRVYKGIVAGLEFTRPPPGEQATCELSIVNSARALTRTLALRKSDASLRARSPNDAFRQYADVSGSIEVVWGEIRQAAPTPVVAGPTPTPLESTNR